MAALVPARREPGVRGRLRVADRVYVKIAARAAREALAGAWRGHAGRGAAPRVSVSTPGTTVAVRVAVDLPFPADLAVLARAVRDRVTADLTAFTGTQVTGVAVTVDRLVPDIAGGHD
ncbi:hypothetical protein ACWEQL_16325 [Kitasatospora sp. NPDC004240]